MSEPTQSNPNQDRYLLARSIFEHLCDTTIEHQSIALDELCGTDKILRDQVEQLLEIDRTDEDQSNLGSINLPMHDTLTDQSTQAPISTKIGEFSIIGILGYGGSSIVYEAKQHNPERSVALKVINTRYFDNESIRRFENEARIMGNISHPNIAKIFQSGSIKNERSSDHYIAMELIRGIDLIEYTQQNLNTIDSKVRVFLDVCDAMTHAHAQGIIHRDLKPGNILVDIHGHVKVLDFGIARSSSADSDMTTMHTQAGRVIGTLAFMSPEQLNGHAHELDERSDVYALGVILFRMLANKLPYNFDTLSFYQAAKLVELSNPTRLSTINTKLRGDLDTILAKALERDPGRRYANVLELRNDLSCYLESKPIRARRASSQYHARQFVRRHKGLSAGFGAAILILIGGLITTSIALAQTVKSEQLAVEKSEISEAITSFLLKDLLEQADARTSTNRELTIAQALDQAASNIDERFTDKPIIEAEIRRLIGRTYTSLGQYAIARPHLDKALQIHTEMLGKDDPETLLSMEELGVLLNKSGANQESLQLQENLFARSKNALGDEAPLTLRAANDLALVYTNIGRYEEAKTLHEQTLETRLRLHGEDDFGSLVSMHNLGLVHLFLGEPEKAIKLYEQVVPGRVKLLGDDHQASLLSMNNLAGGYRDFGQTDQAISLYQRVLQSQKRTLGPKHPDTLRIMANIGSTLLNSSPQQALVYLRDAYTGRLDLYGPNNANTLHNRFLIAYANYNLGLHQQALEELRAIHQAQLELLGPNHRDAMTTQRTITKFETELENYPD